MQKDKISFGPLKDNGGLEKDKQKIMSDKEIKDRLSKTFEDHSIKFNEKQKEILVEAYHTVEQKTRCRQCGDESTFKIMNIRKDDTLFFL